MQLECCRMETEFQNGLYKSNQVAGNLGVAQEQNGCNNTQFLNQSYFRILPESAIMTVSDMTLWGRCQRTLLPGLSQK